jgi:hypothetical protein
LSASASRDRVITGTSIEAFPAFSSGEHISVWRPFYVFDVEKNIRAVTSLVREQGWIDPARDVRRSC